MRYPRIIVLAFAAAGLGSTASQAQFANVFVPELAAIDGALCRSPAAGRLPLLRLAQAQSEPRKKGISPAAPVAAQAVSAPAPADDPQLMQGLGDATIGITTSSKLAQQFFDHLPHVQTAWRYARGVALARKGEAKAAQKELAEIERIVATTDYKPFEAWKIPAKDVGRIAAHVLRARIAQSGNDLDGAAREFRAAVAIQDTQRPAPVTDRSAKRRRCRRASTRRGWAGASRSSSGGCERYYPGGRFGLRLAGMTWAGAILACGHAYESRHDDRAHRPRARCGRVRAA